MAKSVTKVKSTASVHRKGSKKSPIKNKIPAKNKGTAEKKTTKKKIKKRDIFNIKRNVLDILQTRDDGITKISKIAMSELHNMIRDMTDKVIISCGNLANRANRTQVNARDVQAAVKFAFGPGSEMANFMCQRGNLSLTQFLNDD